MLTPPGVFAAEVEKLAEPSPATWSIVETGDPAPGEARPDGTCNR
jgi:hypothetical protein